MRWFPSFASSQYLFQARCLGDTIAPSAALPLATPCSLRSLNGLLLCVGTSYCRYGGVIAAGMYEEIAIRRSHNQTSNSRVWIETNERDKPFCICPLLATGEDLLAGQHRGADYKKCPRGSESHRKQCRRKSSDSHRQLKELFG